MLQKKYLKYLHILCSSNDSWKISDVLRAVLLQKLDFPEAASKWFVGILGAPVSTRKSQASLHMSVTSRLFGTIQRRFKLFEWNYPKTLSTWVRRFPLVPGWPMGFRDEWRSESTFPHRDTRRGLVFRNLDFHWFPADLWGFEVNGPQIQTPRPRLPWVNPRMRDGFAYEFDSVRSIDEVRSHKQADTDL